jgi:hypothetical protein
MKANRLFIFLFVLLLGFSGQGFAQKFEIHPYAGGFRGGEWDNNYEFKNEGVYGLKAGGMVSDSVMLEGNVGWLPHMEFKGTDPRARGLIWEFTPSVNFFANRFSKAVPYVTGGVGAITGFIGDIQTEDRDDILDAFEGENDIAIESGDLLRNARTKDPLTPARSLIMEDGDTFFAVSYGGGIKAINLWGPVGLRGDFRGRTMPNFFGRGLSWFEMTGGVTFTWGER